MTYAEAVRHLTAHPDLIGRPLWESSSREYRLAQVAMRERREYRAWLRAHPQSSPKSFRPESSERVTALAEQDDRED